MLNEYLPESSCLNKDVEVALQSISKEHDSPIEMAKAIILLAHQHLDQGDQNTADYLKDIAANIVDKVVNDGIENLTALT